MKKKDAAREFVRLINPRDPEALASWHDAHLGTSFGDHASYTFTWRERNRPERIGRAEFSPFAESSGYFSPGDKPCVLNYRVRDRDALPDELPQKGVRVEEKSESFEHGTFGWIIDPEGNQLGLWEPIDEPLERMS